MYNANQPPEDFGGSLPMNQFVRAEAGQMSLLDTTVQIEQQPVPDQTVTHPDIDQAVDLTT